MALRRIALHYDCISPYSWIGFELMMRHSRIWNDPSVQIELKPTFLGGIMQGSGNKPPGVVPGKMVYMGRDLMRLNEFTGMELNMLSDPFTTLFKKGSIKAMRAITAMDMNSPEIVERVSTEVWKKIWIHDLDITDEAVLMDAFAKAGLSEEQGREFLGLASTKAVKNKLKENTEEALDAGCFGAPSFIVRQEGEEDKMFFGQDRIELLCHELNLPYHGAAKEGKIF
ncbi:Oidioi.mRNA.OKI2018_I69.PAR.g10399.t1.cds [Oikopleura dioica]|uniref:Glutathione S-transferase kappa n=1 Tax=Oikopleura dioica TaxID=34765 RepID=A0ABN7RQE3_OIKDI|nr:Oidioi.mRNA.OKI2018_I69.PAR.g10399.t1.cds [Oikopleura dioica]